MRADAPANDSPAAAVATALADAPAPPSVPGAGPHLASLDGARGLAAAYVVLHHAYYLCVDPGGILLGMPRSVSMAFKVLAYGRTAVDLFIVLSGFVLMMPVTRSGDRQLRGGTISYLLRRSRRILPPYYAALALTLLLICVQPMAMVAVDGKLTGGSVISHLLMIHNFHDGWNRALNAPMWSVATEWDIYFVFPLLLLPAWRRFGAGALLAAAAALSIVPQTFGHGFIDWAAPWFILLFAMGMAGAAIACEPGLTPARRRTFRRWSGAMALAGVILFLTCYAEKSRFSAIAYPMCSDFAVGFAAACFVVFCAAQPQPAGGSADEAISPVVRFLQSRAPVALGRFSYSLYLTHWPMLALAHGWAVRLGLSAGMALALMLIVAAPAAGLASYGFYLVFERPFLASRRSSAGGTPGPDDPRAMRSSARADRTGSLHPAEPAPAV